MLKFLSSLFSYISLKLYLGCKKSCSFGTIFHAKTKESFPLVVFFLKHFCIHAPLLSFVSYPAGDKKVVIRFLENTEGRAREGELVSLAFTVLELS